MAEQVLGIPNQTQYDLRFRLFGVQTRTHPLFWLMAALIGHSFAGDDLLRIAIAGVCVFVSILVHEFGHALSGRHFGDSGNSVVLYMMGGLCIPGRAIPPRWPRIAMIFWGPLAGFLLAGISYGFNYAVLQRWIPLDVIEITFALVVLIYINTFWSIFNLLPVYPLDGGQILRESLLWKRPRGGEALAFLISMISAIVVSIAGTVYCILNHMPPPIFMIAMMLYFAFQSWQLRQQVLLYGSLGGGEMEEPRAAWEQDPDWWKKR